MPFAELFQALALDESHLLLVRRHLLLPRQARAADAAHAHRGGAGAAGPTGGRLRISRFQAGLWEELAALGVVERQAAAWQQQVPGCCPRPRYRTRTCPQACPRTCGPTSARGWLAAASSGRPSSAASSPTTWASARPCRRWRCCATPGPPIRTAPPFLVVAPTSVLPNWAAEAARFAPDLRVVTLGDTLRRRGEDLATAIDGADVVLTTYTLLRLDADALRRAPLVGPRCSTRPSTPRTTGRRCTRVRGACRRRSSWRSPARRWRTT